MERWERKERRSRVRKGEGGRRKEGSERPGGEGDGRLGTEQGSSWMGKAATRG